ncbi:MAG: hypothetical protein AAB036_02395 [Elusimicrobiota bacterium]
MDAKEPEQKESEPIDVPQALPPPSGSEAIEFIRLEVRVEELERRLRARTIELGTELKAKERLRERVGELTLRIDELQETASALHREAVSATALAHQLESTLKIASEARQQLEAGLEGERSRRQEAEQRAVRAEAQKESALKEAAERSAVVDVDSLNKKEEELSSVRRQVAQLRQKTAGQEAHIEALRAEREQALRARDEAMEDLKGAREQARSAQQMASQEIENAENIRREGVEALEKAREGKIRQDVEAERLRAEIAETQRRMNEESQAFKNNAEKLRIELCARAEREGAQMRRELDEERARLYADIESERQARGHSAPLPAALSRDQEAPPQPPEMRAMESSPAPEAPGQSQTRETATPVLDQSPGFQRREEVRILVWVVIGVILFAAIVVASVLYRG